MTSTSAALGRATLVGAGILAAFLCAGRARAQAGPEARTFETIEVTGARPVARAMDVIEKRYGVLIDYVDPQYVAPQDLQLVRSLHGKPLRAPLQAPKARTISVQYWQVPGTPRSVAPVYRCTVATLGCAPVTTRPEDGIRALIQQVLDQFAEQGGQVFAVRRLEMPYGTRWEVYPTEARGRSGTLVAQPDLLSARIFIPKGRRWPAEMLELIAQQLTRAWGADFSAGTAIPLESDVPGVLAEPEVGPEDVTAGRAIAELAGRWATLRLLYGTDDHSYGINIVYPPYREPPRPPTPAPVPARTLPPGPQPPGYWLGRARTPEGIREIQRGLAKLGYLQTAPKTQWDANAVAALRRFQQARGLPETGKFDHWTALMLSPSLPLVHMVVPAKPAMSIALLYWLNGTPSGRKEVQDALAKAGFYSGPINGQLHQPTVEALKAFQTESGLKPTGLLDWATAVELSPFLPQPK
jgi:hypothetical protein